MRELDEIEKTMFLDYIRADRVAYVKISKHFHIMGKGELAWTFDDYIEYLDELIAKFE